MDLGPNFFKISRIFKEKQSFAIFGHSGPDLDCLGSQLSLGLFLESLGKKVFVIAKNVSNSLKFLPGVEKIVSEPPNLSTVEAVIVVDSSPHLGDFYLSHSFLLQDFYPIIEIDHHQKKLSKDSLHIHLTDVSSTCEINYQIFKNLGFKITKDMANLLLAGIYGDTSGFLNTNVYASTLDAASDLVSLGAEVSLVMENALSKITMEEIELWSLAFKRLNVNDKSKIAHTFLTLDDTNKYKEASEKLSGLSNFINSIKEAKISLVLSEKSKGTIKGSLRSRSEVDVNKIAKLFSPTGGGHIKASGFSIPGTFVKSANGWAIQKI